MALSRMILHMGHIGQHIHAIRDIISARGAR